MVVLKSKRGPHIRNNDNEEGKNINLPYIKGTTEKITRILKKGNIKVSFSPPGTLRKMLDHAKDAINQDCKKVYILSHAPVVRNILVKQKIISSKVERTLC
jgi:UDP-N-acetyl-D-mannosaminuronate dehydrogenase